MRVPDSEIENSIDAEKRLAPGTIEHSANLNSIENSIDAEKRLAPASYNSMKGNSAIENSIDAEKRLALDHADSFNAAS